MIKPWNKTDNHKSGARVRENAQNVKNVKIVENVEND